MGSLPRSILKRSEMGVSFGAAVLGSAAGFASGSRDEEDNFDTEILKGVSEIG
jgi:hypothetical protein